MRYVLLFLCLVTGLVAAVPVTAPAAGAAAVTLHSCKDSARTGTASILLKGGDAEVTVSAELTLQDARESAPTVTIADAKLPANATKLISLMFTFTNCTVPSSGVLILRAGEGSLPYNLTFKVVPDPNCDDAWGALRTPALCGPPIAAALIAIVADWLVRKKLTKRMGSPQWDFGTSWATNVTLGGGLLGLVTGFSLFPENGHFLSKSTYLAVSVAFSALAALAPQAYNVFRKPVDDPNNPAGMQLQGYVLAFVIAAALTSWAAIGQTAAAALAIAELSCSGYLDSCLASPLIVLMILLSIGLTVYVVCTVQFTVKHQLSGTAPLTAARADGKPLPIPNWYVP